MASDRSAIDRFEGWIPFLMLAVFGVSAWRTDLRALGYGVIVFLLALFGLSCLLVAGAWLLLRHATRSGEGRPPLAGTLLRSGWFWGYALFVVAFLGLWPWR